MESWAGDVGSPLPLAAQTLGDSQVAVGLSRLFFSVDRLLHAASDRDLVFPDARTHPHENAGAGLDRRCLSPEPGPSCFDRGWLSFTALRPEGAGHPLQVQSQLAA